MHSFFNDPVKIAKVALIFAKTAVAIQVFLGLCQLGVIPLEKLRLEQPLLGKKTQQTQQPKPTKQP